MGPLFGSLFAVALLGCREAESVKTYDETPAVESMRTVVDVEEVRAATDHMLAAIVAERGKSGAGKAWFFKLTARGDDLDGLRKSFDEFLASVKLQGGDLPPTWTLPESWIEKPASAMRAATIEVPYDGNKLELAVSSLPLGADWDEFVERNVVRWLGQLQQPPLTGKEIAKLLQGKPTQSGEATFVELVGVLEPMAGTPVGGQLPAGHPPIDEAMPADPAPPSGESTAAAPGPSAGSAEVDNARMPQPAEFTYEAPADWRPGAMNAMRRAAFNVTDGDLRAEMTVMPFPAVGMMADPTAQAQRWAGQIGLQMSADEVKAAAKPTTIDGIAGESFELLGPEGEAKPLAILAAMVKRGDQVWFFKMTGDRKLVESQREPFNQFLESIKFADDGE